VTKENIFPHGEGVGFEPGRRLIREGVGVDAHGRYIDS
jgi:hypothetical protein